MLTHPDIDSPVYTVWCACGLRMTGSTGQVVEQAVAHWGYTACPWRFYDTNPQVC